MSNEHTIRDLQAMRASREADRRRAEQAIEALDIAIAMFKGDTAPTPRRRSHSASLSDAMHDILVRERPLHRTTLLERVRAAGFHVGGKTPVGAIGSYLSRDERFTNIGRGCWSLTEEPAPATPEMSEEEEMEEPDEP